MSKIASLLMLVAILIAGLVMLQQLPAVVDYAAAWDSGQPSGAFAEWAGLEPPNTAWIAGCRAALLPSP